MSARFTGELGPDDRVDNVGEGAQSDPDSQRSGLAERDAIGPVADMLSPTGARMDNELPPEQEELLRAGDTQPAPGEGRL